MDRLGMHAPESVSGDPPRAGNVFLAGNPLSFGWISDACPAAARTWMAAAGGATGDGAAPSVYREKAERLTNRLFGRLLPRSEDTESILRATFGEVRSGEAQPVARFGAALAEAEAARILRSAPPDAPFAQTAALLGDGIFRRLSDLRDLLRADIGFADAPDLEVSFGACRAIRREGGDCVVDIFSAGRFSVFLLDEDGMRPLWREGTPLLSSAGSSGMRGRRLELRHPQPFALLLLSEGASVPPAGTADLEGASPWRGRVGTEGVFLRILASCEREGEFGARAARYFTEHAADWDSASGALIIVAARDVPFEVFRAACRRRLSAWRELSSWMAGGYDPDSGEVAQDRLAEERAFLRRLWTERPGIQPRVKEALATYALEVLKRGEGAAAPPAPEDSPDPRRLTYAEAYRIFRRYDEANDGDRARVAEDRRAMRDSLSEHWVTLRPLLCRDGTAGRDGQAERSFAACVRMNRRLFGMLSERRSAVARAEELLREGLAGLRANGEDLIYGRGADGGAKRWALRLKEGLAPLLASLAGAWGGQTDRFRALLSAYTAERDRLFALDTAPGSGAWSADFQALFEGTMTDDRADELAERLAPLTDRSYAELFGAARALSGDIRARSETILARSAARRMAEEIAGQPEWQMSCLLASAYADPDWGPLTRNVMDERMREEYRRTMRLRREERERAARGEAAFRAYRRMYDAYAGGGEGRDPRDAP